MSGIDARLDALIRPFADAIARIVFFEIEVLGGQLPLVVLWLAFGAVFFTVYFRLRASACHREP